MKRMASCVAAGLFTVLLSSTFSSRAGVPGDEHWDNRFGPSGVNGNAYGIAVIGNKVFAAGQFTAAGGVKTSGAAGFDGTNWFPLNGGLPYPSGGTPTVIYLAADGNYVYAGGLFASADDPTAIDTARWDGTNWAGIGIQGLITSLKRNGSKLYFGGSFSGANGVISTNIIAWDGTNWFALGQGLGGTGNNLIGSVNTMTFQGNNLYVGGNFSYSGASSMTNVAYWDGTVWHAMGNPFPGGVNALAWYGGYLYAGGFFTNTILHLTNMARWDGSVWSAVPGGGANRLVSDFATDGTNLYIGGQFTQIGGIPATNIVVFDGANWTQLGGGLHYYQYNGLGQANKLCWYSNQLYVAGSFDRAGDYVGADCVARWDGTRWWSLAGKTGKGMGIGLDFVFSLFSLNQPANAGAIRAGLYAGGFMPTAGSTNVNSIGFFDGTNWNALGNGISGYFSTGTRVYSMATDGTYLYAAGSFTNAGSYTGVGGIAAWDGANWSPLWSGLDWNVYSLAVDGYGYLWVGGGFTNVAFAGGSAQGLDVWKSGNWYNFGAVGGTNATVSAIVYDGGTRIYIGGQFYTVDDGLVSATNIAYFDWSDGQWHALGNGANSKVSALAYDNGVLYAGGTFTNVGGVAANRIAKWNGSSWSALGSGITGTSSAIVNGVAVAGGNVYVTGSFTNAGGVVITNAAYWDGSAWHGMGTGLASSTSTSGYTIATSGNDVYLGGNFLFAGDKPEEFIAHWNIQSNFYPAANLSLARSAWLTNKTYRFRVNGTYGQSYIIQATTNFSTWTSLQTNGTTYYDFTDTGSTNLPYRFYRAVLGP